MKKKKGKWWWWGRRGDGGAVTWRRADKLLSELASWLDKRQVLNYDQGQLPCFRAQPH